MNVPSTPRAHALALLFALVQLGCAAQHTSIPRCVPGTEAACGCTNGSVGTQRCEPNGQYAACICEESTLDAGLPDAAGSDVFTLPDARLDTPRCIAPEDEWCDGRDNDCDGVVDNGHVCPDDTVAFVEPFNGGVWFGGYAAAGAAIQRFWPSLNNHYRLVSGHRGSVFRPSDNALYSTTHVGLHSEAGEPAIPTPPCIWLTIPFRFDVEDRAYYACDNTLFRDGAPFVSDVAWVEAVLPSGRAVIVRSDMRTFTLIDADGTELTRPFPSNDWSGAFAPLASSSSVQGERAWLMALRTFSDASTELVVLRVDANTEEWNVVRRLPMMGHIGNARIALPDGHVLLEREDAKTFYEVEFVDIPPDGPPRIIWREIEALEVSVHGPHQFLTGPLE